MVSAGSSQAFLCALIITLVLTPLSAQADWMTAAHQNQTLRDHYLEEYWAGRNTTPQDLRHLSRSADLTAPKSSDIQNEVPAIERLGRSKVQGPPKTSGRPDKYADKQIRRLVKKVDQKLATIQKNYENLLTVRHEHVSEEPVKQNPHQGLGKHLKKIGSEARSLRSVLGVVLHDLKQKDEFQFKPPDDFEEPIASAIDLLGAEIESAFRKVRSTLAGTQVVSIEEMTENALILLYHVQKTAEGIEKTL